MADVSVADVLRGQVPVGQEVTVKGWVRTRRDSKGGFSFITVHDGSCFDPVQVVAPNTLPNYTTEIVRLTAGCACVVRGLIAQSVGKGQAFEVQAAEVRVVGLLVEPDPYPMSPK